MAHIKSFGKHKPRLHSKDAQRRLKRPRLLIREGVIKIEVRKRPEFSAELCILK